jgi:hypothetical protein
MAQKFIQKAKTIYGEKYDYSNVVFFGLDTPVKIRCTEHGVFEIKPRLHLGIRTGKCPDCIYSKICRDRSLLGLSQVNQNDFTDHWNQISRMV